MTILYVEDSDDLRDTIGMLLEAPGREVLCCATAEEALALLAEREADIVITDVSLPGMSGTDFARKLLADAPNRRIVLCSGYEFGDAVGQFGPNVRALLKPFEPEEMEALVNEVCDQVRTPA
ncbi:response regulator [Piscinibacter sp. HJYY11]|uniref:response regulator n=1 Tax=Piscinibacter sp. HJYY11 TaxID=2801333 RepID=UPI00191E7EE9|nr:response regulator [Piscinibacter sp. HJYY11]MBL0727777.1 response regulator [Piscinibacter sp. HJYY11]